MGPSKTPEKAIENELSCYYHGDELASVQSAAFRLSLRRRTWASAVRLRRSVGEPAVAQLVRVLESLHAEPYGFLMCVIIEATLIGWPDDPRDWMVFREIVEQIIHHLHHPGPRPA
jgi:hypothetical protein